MNTYTKEEEEFVNITNEDEGEIKDDSHASPLVSSSLDLIVTYSSSIPEGS